MTAFLISHWRLALGLALTAVLALYVGYLRHEVHAWEGRYAAAQKEVGQRVSERDQAIGAAKACSEGVQQLQAEGEKRVLEAQEALRRAQAAAKVQEGQAERWRVLARSGPKGSSACPAHDALEVIRQGLAK